MSLVKDAKRIAITPRIWSRWMRYAYDKRIGAHPLNPWSSVAMPLHTLDYYNERMLEDNEERVAESGRPLP